MMDLIDSAAALVRLNGGEVVGKTRLQKIAYLLEALDLGLGLEFDYHNYGPFSAELAMSLDDAESLGFLKTREGRGFHEVPYTIFESTSTAPEFENSRETTRRKAALDKMSGFDALILELAATAVYLDRNGFKGLAWDEVKKRKPLKATADRIRKAKELLTSLDLES